MVASSRPTVLDQFLCVFILHARHTSVGPGIAFSTSVGKCWPGIKHRAAPFLVNSNPARLKVTVGDLPYLWQWRQRLSAVITIIFNRVSSWYQLQLLCLWRISGSKSTDVRRRRWSISGIHTFVFAHASKGRARRTFVVTSQAWHQRLVHLACSTAHKQLPTYFLRFAPANWTRPTKVVSVPSCVPCESFTSTAGLAPYFSHILGKCARLVLHRTLVSDARSWRRIQARCVCGEPHE